jgi:membrane protease subunit HflK
MAWNEPGGGNNSRDPWGSGNQGPPDLDEALKKLQERLGGLFGRSGGGSGGGSGGRQSASLLVLRAVSLLVWGLMGFYQIDEQERAVVLRFGKYHATRGPVCSGIRR